MTWVRIMLAIWATAAPILASERAAAGDAAAPFSTDDRVIIERNAALRQLASRDPRLVRAALDAIATAAQTSGTTTTSMERDAVMSTPKPKPSRNPDLDNLERSSPEAAHDLFQLIKKASENRKSR